jgi:hypothetical protein
MDSTQYAGAGFVDPAAAVQHARGIIERRQAEEAPPAVEGEPVNRVDLPSGGWAELADPRKIRAKHRKRVMDQLNLERMQSGKGGIALDMTDGLIIMMVEKWHIPYLPNVGRPLDDPDSTGELTIPDYDRLTDELEPAREMIFPSPPTVDGANKPGSPTRPAGA